MAAAMMILFCCIMVSCDGGGDGGGGVTPSPLSVICVTSSAWISRMTFCPQETPRLRWADRLDGLAEWLRWRSNAEWLWCLPGVWCMVYGVCVWCMVYGVVCVVCVVCVWCGVCGVCVGWCLWYIYVSWLPERRRRSGARRARAQTRVDSMGYTFARDLYVSS